MNFQVELTSYCDLTCGYCPNKDMQRPRKFMSDDVWNKILHDYILEYWHINLHCPPTFIGHKDGEPLLNKGFTDRLSDIALHAPDMKIDIYSHGLMLPKLAKQGRDLFEFFWEIPNQVRYMMSYHPYNHDGSKNDYLPVVDYLRRILEAPPPNVEFITVSHRSKWVSDELQDLWRATWSGYPITVHSNCSLNPWTGRIEEEGVTQFNGCPYADFGHWFFGVTGNIIPCCLDLEEEIILGNVLEDDPAEMFDKTQAFYSEQRRILETKEQHPHGVCRNCFGQERDGLVNIGVSA